MTLLYKNLNRAVWEINVVRVKVGIKANRFNLIPTQGRIHLPTPYRILLHKLSFHTQEYFE